MAKRSNINSTFQNFEWQVPRIVPTLIKGKDAERLCKTILNEGLDLGFMDYNYETQELRCSNPLRTGQIYRIVAPSGLRVATPTDNIYENVFPLIKGKFYSDLNALDVREKNPSYEKNTGLWRKLIELAEKTQGRVKFPFRVQGFYTMPNKSEDSYGIEIVPADNFRIIEDERLALSSQTKFSKLDENGMILPDKKGDYNWYSREDGLSGLCLDRDGDLHSYYDYLVDSIDDGRVVLLTAEGSAQNFLKNKIKQLQIERDQEFARINERYSKAESILRGKE
mgnify:CR=1 FL=1